MYTNMSPSNASYICHHPAYTLLTPCLHPAYTLLTYTYVTTAWPNSQGLIVHVSGSLLARGRCRLRAPPPMCCLMPCKCGTTLCMYVQPPSRTVDGTPGNTFRYWQHRRGKRTVGRGRSVAAQRTARPADEFDHNWTSPCLLVSAVWICAAGATRPWGRSWGRGSHRLHRRDLTRTELLGGVVPRRCRAMRMAE